MNHYFEGRYSISMSDFSTSADFMTNKYFLRYIYYFFSHMLCDWAVNKQEHYITTQ